MIYSFGDNSKEAKKYRVRQMAANSAISGREISEEDIRRQEAWIDEGLSQDECVRRLVVEHIGGDTTAEKVQK